VADDLRMALLQVLRRAEVDEGRCLLTKGVRAMAVHLVRLEVSHLSVPTSCQRMPNRNGQRNGYRYQSRCA
jgi:hypothetical protein